MDSHARQAQDLLWRHQPTTFVSDSPRGSPRPLATREPSPSSSGSTAVQAVEGGLGLDLGPGGYPTQWPKIPTFTMGSQQLPKNEVARRAVIDREAQRIFASKRLPPPFSPLHLPVPLLESSSANRSSASPKPSVRVPTANALSSEEKGDSMECDSDAGSSDEHESGGDEVDDVGLEVLYTRSFTSAITRTETAPIPPANEGRQPQTWPRMIRLQPAVVPVPPSSAPVMRVAPRVTRIPAAHTTNVAQAPVQPQTSCASSSQSASSCHSGFPILAEDYAHWREPVDSLLQAQLAPVSATADFTMAGSGDLEPPIAVLNAPQPHANPNENPGFVSRFHSQRSLENQLDAPSRGGAVVAPGTGAAPAPVGNANTSPSASRQPSPQKTRGGRGKRGGKNNRRTRHPATTPAAASKSRSPTPPAPRSPARKLNANGNQIGSGGYGYCAYVAPWYLAELGFSSMAEAEAASALPDSICVDDVNPSSSSPGPAPEANLVLAVTTANMALYCHQQTCDRQLIIDAVKSGEFDGPEYHIDDDMPAMPEEYYGWYERAEWMWLCEKVDNWRNDTVPGAPEGEPQMDLDVEM